MEQQPIPNWGLAGHEWAVEMLREQIRRDSVRHAYLLTGPAGVGRRTLALRFAQALDCPTPLAPGEPCGKCRTCRQIERQQYPDLLVLQSEKEGGTIKVEQARDLTRTFSLKPFQGKYRLGLFLRFQEANDNAANALLKTLEDAPPQAVILLTADNPEQVLPTIVSRCEVLRLRPLQVDELEKLLKQRGAEEAQARLLAHISGGRVGYALRLLEGKNKSTEPDNEKEPDELKFRAERLDDLARLLKATRVERFAYAEKATERRRGKETLEKFRRTLLIWLSFWRDVLLCVSGGEAPLVNIDRQAEIEALAGRLSLAEARKLVAETENAIDRLDRNVNARLQAEVLLLDLPHG